MAEEQPITQPAEVKPSVPNGWDDINLNDEGLGKVSVAHLTPLVAISLFLKRFAILWIKLAGSRTMLLFFINYCLGLYVMDVFIRNKLDTEVMKTIFYLYIVLSVFVLLVLGVLRVKDIEFKYEKK